MNGTRNETENSSGNIRRSFVSLPITHRLKSGLTTGCFKQPEKLQHCV